MQKSQLKLAFKKGLEVGTERGRWDFYVLMRELYQWPMSSNAKSGTFGNTYKDFHYNDFTYNFGNSPKICSSLLVN